MDRDPAKEPPITSFLRSTGFNPGRSTNGFGTKPLGGSSFTPGPPTSLSSAMRTTATSVSNGGWSFAPGPPANLSSAERATATPVSEQGPKMAAYDNHNARFPPPKPHATAPPMRLAGTPSIPSYSRFLSARPPAGDFNEPVIDVVTGKPFIPDPAKMAVKFVPGEGIVPNRGLAPSPYRPGRLAQQFPSLKLSTPSTAEDIVSKNADSIISQNVRSAAALDVRYKPPILRKPYLDSQRRIQRAPVDPRIIGLPQVPESWKDDGRQYAKVLVDPKLRMIRFPDWIREQWLSAEWRRCESSEHVEVKSDRFDVIEYFREECVGSKEEHKPEKVAREAMQPLRGINTEVETASKAVKEEQVLQKDEECLAVLEKTIQDPKAAESKTDLKAALENPKVEEAKIGILETIAAFSKAAKAAETDNTRSKGDTTLELVRQEVMKKMREKVAALDEATGFSKPAEVEAALEDALQQALQESTEKLADLSKAAEANKAVEVGLEVEAKAASENAREQIVDKVRQPATASAPPPAEYRGPLESKIKATEQDAAELSVLKVKAQTAKDVKEANQSIQDIYKQLMSIDKLEIERKNSWLQGKKYADRNAVWKRNALANLKAASTLAEELHEKMRMIEAVEAARNQKIGAKPAVVLTQKVDHVEKGWVLLENEMDDGKSTSPGGKGDFTRVLELLTQLMKEGGSSDDLMKLVDRMREEKMSTAGTIETITGWMRGKTSK